VSASRRPGSGIDTMSHVFISHVEEDADVALGIALGLEQAGFPTWCYEVDSIPGPSYLIVTGQAIERSGAVVVVVSADSLGSKQMTREVVRAHESGKPFVPVLRGVTHLEFQARQPEWREAIGAATSIGIPSQGVAEIMPQVAAGLRALGGIESRKRADPARLEKIRRKLDELSLPESARLPVGQPRPADKARIPIEDGAHGPAPVWNLAPTAWRWISRPAARRVVILGAVGLTAVTAIFGVAWLLSGGGDDGSGIVIFPSTFEGRTPTVTPAHPTSAATAARPSATIAHTPRVSPTAAPISTPTADERSPKVLWRFETSHSLSPSSPVVVDQVAYIGSSDGIYALDAATAEERWHFDAGAWVSTPAVKDGVVYVGGADMGADEYYVYALDAATGEERWRFQPGGSVTSPTVADGIVYLASDDNYVYALDAATGKWLWRFKAGFEGDVVGLSTPAVADGVVYIGSGDNYLYALDGTTGELRWRREMYDDVSSPKVLNGLVYFGSWLGGVRALDAATGEDRWASGEDLSGSLAVDSGSVYIGSGPSGVYALDAATGEERWHFRTGAWFSSPAVADDMLCIGGHVIETNESYLYGLDIGTGQERWRFRMGSQVASPPAAANGVIYVGSQDGHLYALDTTTLEERWVPEQAPESGP